jgi:alpha-tubulin suppressor-like RCC1 family protein
MLHNENPMAHYDKSRVDRYLNAGFALPTIIIASVVMLIVLASSATAVSTLRNNLNNQYYDQLAREASESGVAYATQCLVANNYNPTWGTNNLTPATDCNGVANGKPLYLVDNGNIQTSFVVGPATTNTGGYVQLQVSGNINLLRTSTGDVWKTTTQSQQSVVRYKDTPTISGGAGWQNNGHIGAILSANGQVYSFGANSQGQVLGVASPVNVTLPSKMKLPTGVNSVKKLMSSGQGASFVCIIGDDSKVYCQGAAGAAENGLMTTTPGWQQFGTSLSYSAVDMSIKGYGADGICVLTAAQTVYCAGENYYGSLGTGDTTYSISKISSPQEMVVRDGGGVKQALKSVKLGDAVVCAITTANDLYCAGINSSGQIGGVSTNGTGNGVYATPIKYPIPGTRWAQDVTASYHNGTTNVHVLATDGTIWCSGMYNNGDCGNGTTTGSTGTTQTPVLFGGIGTYGTGSALKNPQSGRCIDNNGGSSANGNIIQLYDCNGTVAQEWVFNNGQIANIGTGKCLDDPSNNLTHGVKLQLYTCNGSNAQKFVLGANNSIIHPSSGLCIDATANGTANGTLLELWDCYGNGAQAYTNDGTFNGWQGMIAGNNFFCGLRQDNWSGMWCAGDNSLGQLDNSSPTGNTFLTGCAAISSTYPIFNVNLPGGAKADVNRLSPEWQQQYNTNMVIATNGKVFGGGRNIYGKLGDGSTGDTANSNRECTTTEFPLPAGVTAMDMSARDEFTTYVLGSDNKIYSAGYNVNGQIGDGTTTNRLSPVEVEIPREQVNY